MKKVVNTVLAAIFFLVAGCGERRKLGNQGVCLSSALLDEAFVSIDVGKKYAQKELLLQEFMDVEYVALETTDEFVCQGVVLAIGKEIILMRNRINDGNILVFDRNGKGLRKINRLGRGNEEYMSYFSVILDEEQNEIFVDNFRTIMVYDLHGNYNRSFQKGAAMWGNIQNFDREHLICREMSSNIERSANNNQRFAIISKRDGNVVHFRVCFFSGLLFLLMFFPSGNFGKLSVRT